MTTVLDDAISTYRAAAMLLSKVAQLRVNLLDSMLETSRQQVTLFEGYHAFSNEFGICIPSGSRATLTLNRTPSEGATIESDLPEWMTLEGWLPESAMNASSCFIEIEMDIDEPITANMFVRDVDANYSYDDSPTTIVQLGTEGLTVLRIDLPTLTEGSRRKIVLQLRYPPSSFKLRGFSLIPL